jgi:dTMP kinase
VPPHGGLFISFEGGDGSGKTTQARELATWLAAVHGWEVVLTREPGGTPLGRTLRDLVLHGEDLDPRTEALLFAADRAHHVATVIRPALARGAAVITDRYLDSSVAYQAGGGELDPREVESLSWWATNMLLPDLTILLDIDPRVGASRLTSEPDRMERAGLEFHDRTRAAFRARAAADPERWLILDGAASREVITAQIRQRVELLAAVRRGEIAPQGEAGLGEVGHPGETGPGEVGHPGEAATSSGESG